MLVNFHKSALKMMMRAAYTVCGLLLFPLAASHAAGSEDVLWQKANAFYSRKQYDSAKVYYGLLLQKYPANAVLHYNAGNVNYRLNEVGQAVLHYEKATFLDPSNQAARDNLLLARERVLNPVPEVKPIFFVTWWNNWVHLLGSNTWGILSLLTFTGILVVIYFARVRKERFAHSGRWLSLGIVSFLVCGCMTWFSYDAATNSRKAVVLQAGTSLTEAPRTTGKVLGTLPEGTVVEVYQVQGSFMNVKLPNGREGWIPVDAAGKV
jgi:tetratricopeptide (TPR) repeat protein